MESRKPNENQVVKAPAIIRPLAEAIGWWQGLQAFRAPEERAPMVDEPSVPVTPQAVPSAANEAQPVAQATAPRSPATLAELGLPQDLARGLEVAMRVMGATRQGEVIGFRFRTPDGTEHRLRIDEAA